MVSGKKPSGRPTQRTEQQNQKSQPQHFHSNDSSSSGMQYSGSGEGQNFPGKNACTRCGRRGHTADACQCTDNAKCFKCGKTRHFSKMCIYNSAHAQSRARPRVHKNLTMLLGMSVNRRVPMKNPTKTNMRTQLHMVKQ